MERGHVLRAYLFQVIFKTITYAHVGFAVFSCRLNIFHVIITRRHIFDPIKFFIENVFIYYGLIPIMPLDNRL